jgi:hypothetical protein
MSYAGWIVAGVMAAAIAVVGVTAFVYFIQNPPIK